MRSTRWWTAVPLGAALVAVVALGPGFGNGAASGAGGGESIDEDGMPTEELVAGNGMVLDVVDPLMDLVDPNAAGERVTTDGAEYGYAGVTVDPLERVVDVYWVGTVDAEAQRILDDAPAGVTVRVHQAKYTYSEMLAALDRVVGMPVPGGSSDLMILAAGPASDGSGIWIEYSGSGSPESIAESAARMAGIDIASVAVGEEMQTAEL